MKTFTRFARAIFCMSIVFAIILPTLALTVAGQTPADTVDNSTGYPYKKPIPRAAQTSGEAPLAPPANDNFANAVSLSIEGYVTGTNVDATGETGELNHAGASGVLNSVWYKFTAPAAGVFSVRTAPAGAAPLQDTVMTAYAGSSIDHLSAIVESDDYIDYDVYARLAFTVQPAETYYVVVDGYANYQGSFKLFFEYSDAAANDNFANAEDLGTLQFGPYHGVIGSNAYSTSEPGEPVHEAGIPLKANSIWYKWTSNQAGTVTFRTDGSNYDTVLAVYTGSSVDNLALVAKNDDFGPQGSRVSRVTFFAPPGVYYLAIDGFADSFGNSSLKWEPYREDSGKRWDFDNDSKSDISIFRPSNGQWWIKGSLTGVSAHTFGASSDKITPADFTGDGRVDIAVWRPSNGNWYVLRSENNTYYSAPFGQSGDIPAVGQFDRDAKADHAIFRPSTGTFYILKSFNGQTDSVPWGTSGDIPSVADYDGDGRSDVAIFRPSNGQWWILRSKSGAIGMSFGSATDKPVVGDYTGDGRADVAFWRPSSGEWFVLRSEDMSYYSGPFGQSTDIPVPGDYDGDRRTDLAVFRPSEGMWYIAKSSGGFRIEPFGSAGDKPAPNAFVP